MENLKTIGIVGGMGPEAGVTLYQEILKNVDAAYDQDYPSVVLMSFGNRIGDRTKFLNREIDENPGIAIAKIIHQLWLTGAGVIGLACNTSYAPEIFKVILEKTDPLKGEIRLLNMPEEVVANIKETWKPGTRIGVLSTNGTYMTGTYENLLMENNFQYLTPEPDFQDEVIHRMIYDKTFGIKSNAGNVTQEAIKLFQEALEYFKNNGVNKIILGCTELSTMVPFADQGEVTFIDSSTCMALALLRESGYQPTKSLDSDISKAPISIQKS